MPPTRHSDPVAPELVTASSRKPHLLLVEDTPVNREVATGMLDILGHSVHAVENGRLALEVRRDRADDLILMDCQMPEMDGFTPPPPFVGRASVEGEVAHRVRRIIALTANADGGRSHPLSGRRDGRLSGQALCRTR